MGTYIGKMERRSSNDELARDYFRDIGTRGPSCGPHDCHRDDCTYLLCARLHQLDQVQEENVSVLIAETVHGIRHRAGVMENRETVAGLLEVDVLLGRSREFLRST